MAFRNDSETLLGAFTVMLGYNTQQNSWHGFQLFSLPIALPIFPSFICSPLEE